MEERLVAYFDILGFKELIKNNPINIVVEKFTSIFNSLFSASVRHSVRIGFTAPDINGTYKYLELDNNIADIFSVFEKETLLTPLMFSDSLLLYSGNCKRGSEIFFQELVKLTLASRVITARLFNNIFPSRGAIAYGEFYVDKQKSIYCGKSLVEAVEWTENQEWIGTILCPSIEVEANILIKAYNVEKYLEGVKKREHSIVRPDWDLLQYNVPLKTGTRKCFVINWASEWNAGGPVRDDFFSDVMTGDDRIDRKYKNTLHFLQNWTKGCS
jgi:hypothetical protein